MNLETSPWSVSLTMHMSVWNTRSRVTRIIPEQQSTVSKYLLMVLWTVRQSVALMVRVFATHMNGKLWQSCADYFFHISPFSVCLASSLESTFIFTSWTSFTSLCLPQSVLLFSTFPIHHPSLFHSKLKTCLFGKSFPPLISYHRHLGLTSSANGAVFCFYCLCRCYLMFLMR